MSIDLSKIKFTNLVQRSHWTIPMGVGNVKKQIQGVLKKGLNGFVITDQNIMSGVLETYFLSKDKDFLEKSKIEKLPIGIGAIMDFTDDLENKDLSRLFSLTLYAKNQTGYKNLIYLNSISSDPNHTDIENLKGHKRLSISELMERSEDLVVGSGGINGLLAQSIIKGTGQEEDLAQIFKENFGDDFFIEIHYRPIKTNWDQTLKKYVANDDDIQKTVNLRLIEIAEKYNIKCCLVQSSYMTDPSYYKIQNILIQNHPDYKKSGWILDQPYAIMSVEEMYEFIKTNSPYISDENFIKFCENTQIILEKVKNIKLDFTPSLPQIKYGEHEVNLDKSYEDKLIELRNNLVGFCDLMVHVIDKSINDISLRTTIKTIIRLKKIDWNNKEEVERLAFELKVMQLNGAIRLLDYFLLLEDVTNYVRSIGKYRGFGRGSGGGSFLTYVMDISDVQPIKYKLLFERFLTKERIGVFYFDIENYPYIRKEEENLENPSFQKIKDMIINDREKDINSDYLEKELFYLECNPNDADYLYETAQSILKNGQKIENKNNSTISYLIGITDKIPTDFIKSTPTTLPDFDYDTDARDEVKVYLTQKYGINNVTLMGTIGTLKTKGAIKDIIRQLRPLVDEDGKIIKAEMPQDDVNALTKKFDLFKPADFKTEIEFFEATVKADNSLQKFFNENKDIDEALRLLLGNAKSTGIHAGGIVVSARNVLEVMPMTWSFDENMWITQSEMAYVERVGLIKYDFLGLKTLGDLNRVLKLVNERHNKNYNLSNIPMDEKEIFELFVRGLTESVFQFNTPLATSILVQLKDVKSIVDLAIITSIARPGPLAMEMDKTFIGRNTEKEPITYLHPSLKNILNETLAILVFQEQVLEISKEIGDLDKDDSVKLMKALSKKKPESVQKLIEKLKTNAIKNKGFTDHTAQTMIDLIQAFSLYAFNKCLTGDTLIKTEKDDSISILDIKNKLKKEKVFLKSFNVETSSSFNDECLAVHESGEVDVYEVEFEDGSKVKCTMNHEFLCENGIKYTLKEIIAKNYKIMTSSDKTTIGIKNIKLIGKEQTYDVEMRSDFHNFILENGIVSGNSHAVAYAAVSYLCMWFKSHYPLEWYSAVLTGADKEDFKIIYPKWKDSINRPDINLSKEGFIIDDTVKKVIMPLSSIEGVGDKAADNIIKNQPYSSFSDFYSKIDKRQVNKKTILSLIFSGTFDSMKPEDFSVNKWRKTLVGYFIKLKHAAKKPSAKEKLEDEAFFKSVADMNRGAMLKEEITLLNFTAFDYFDYYKDKMTITAKKEFGKEAIKPGQVAEYPDKASVVVGGSVQAIKFFVVKNQNSKIFGREMASLTINNAGESVEVVIFPDTLERDPSIRELDDYTPVIIQGSVSRFGGKLSISYNKGIILL